MTVVLDGGELEVEVGEDLHVDLTGWAVPVYAGEASAELVARLGSSDDRRTHRPRRGAGHAGRRPRPGRLVPRAHPGRRRADPAELQAAVREDAIRGVRTEVVDITIDLDAPPADVADTYLRLHLLSTASCPRTA